MKKLAIVMLFLISGIFSQEAKAQTVTFYANISGDYSEISWIGHVWVEFAEGNNKQAYGFYPEGVLNDGPRPYDISYGWKVSPTAYREGLKVIQQYQNKGYILGVRDCRSFARAVARAVGLRTPNQGVKSPAEWLADLVDLN